MKNFIIGMMLGAVGMHFLTDGKKSMLKKSKQMLKNKLEEMLD